MAGDARYEQLLKWADTVLAKRHSAAAWQVAALGGDASFRRYFRVRLGEAPGSYLLMDAPPPQEDCRPFVRVAQQLLEHAVPAPVVLAADLDAGFLLLEDFGDALYLPALQRAVEQHGPTGGEPAGALYGQAFEALWRIQSIDAASLPPYDQAALRREMTLFDEWFCGRLLERPVAGPHRDLLESVYRELEDSALAQPQVFVHRDYHSRNLMRRQGDPDGLPGVIDFQDAVRGPVTYDPVSLLRDCYIVWPPAQVEAMALQYRDGLLRHGIVTDYPDADFLRDLDLMGLQRHLKVLGIFSRLYLRDGKPRYLDDLPVVMDYVRTVSARYPSLGDFHDWFARELVPLAGRRLAELQA